MMECRVSLLGEPYVTVDQQMVAFKRKKALALLAYLALETGQQCRRERLLAVFWPDQDEESARAGLRRTLAALTETPLRAWVEADRQSVWLKNDNPLWVDCLAIRSAHDADPDTQAQAVTLYRGAFMDGFTLTDAPPFDDWQTAQTQQTESQMSRLLAQLCRHYAERQLPVQGLEAARLWLQVDPYLEAAHQAYMQMLTLAQQHAAALQHFQRYTEQLQAEFGSAPSAAMHAFVEGLRQADSPAPVSRPRVALLPPAPSLLIGRETLIATLRERLTQHTTRQLILQGWPGIGKSSLSAALAYDEGLQRAFPDGVLWVALGDQPNPRALLMQCGQALGLGTPDLDDSVEVLSARLRSALAHRAVLLIVDDVWNIADALPLRVAGSACASIFTTRFNDVAHALAESAEQVVKIPIISDADALRLLYALAPALQQYESDTLRLVQDLEGLPLALQVAGRLLHAEASLGWGVADLIEELRDGRRLLESKAPADRHEVALQTSPTIAALLQRSVVRLDSALQERFALLGVFAPKPATFALDAVKAIWGDAHPQAAVRTLCDRGLLEPLGDGRFQMHALLVMHARSMFGE